MKTVLRLALVMTAFSSYHALAQQGGAAVVAPANKLDVECQDRVTPNGPRYDVVVEFTRRNGMIASVQSMEVKMIPNPRAAGPLVADVSSGVPYKLQRVVGLNATTTQFVLGPYTIQVNEGLTSLLVNKYIATNLESPVTTPPGRSSLPVNANGPVQRILCTPEKGDPVPRS